MSSVLKQKALNKLYKTVLVFGFFFDLLLYMECFLLMLLFHIFVAVVDPRQFNSRWFDIDIAT